MLPLRYSRGWQAAGVLILVLVFVAAITPAFTPWPRMDVRSLIGADKWLHGLTFLFLAAWFSGQYARRSYWRIALGLLVFGGFIELCQRSVAYRTADSLDLLANVVGLSLGLLLAVAGIGGWSLRVETWLAGRRRVDCSE